MTTLDGRVAIMTGAGRGFGAAIATTLRNAGATVVVSDIDEAAARPLLHLDLAAWRAVTPRGAGPIIHASAPYAGRDRSPGPP